MKSAAADEPWTGPLAGLLVVDLSRALAGPHATMVLADLGARVIKVEPPDAGDDVRTWGPPFVGPEEHQESTYFLAANRNKESIQLDLKDEASMATLKRLIERADVLVENYRPGVLERLGLSVPVLQQLNAQLIVLSITGFGHDGPEGARAGYDQIAQGEAGLMSVTGAAPGHPTRVGVPIGDLLAGLNGAIGVLAALAGRRRRGSGCVIRTSLLAALVGAHAFHGTAWTVAGEVGQATGNHHPQIAPYGTFRCSDGHIQVAVGSDSLWQTFASLLGIEPDDERFRTNLARIRHRDDLITQIEEKLSVGSREHWLAELRSAGIPAGAIKSIDEVYRWKQTRSQGLVISVTHPVLGEIELPGPSLRIEDLEGNPLGRRRHEAPPLLGQHTGRVEEWLAAGGAEQAV